MEKKSESRVIVEEISEDGDSKVAEIKKDKIPQ